MNTIIITIIKLIFIKLKGMVSRVNVVPAVPAVVPYASWPVFVISVYRIFAEMWLVGVGGRVMDTGKHVVTCSVWQID